MNTILAFVRCFPCALLFASCKLVHSSIWCESYLRCRFWLQKIWCEPVFLPRRFDMKSTRSRQTDSRQKSLSPPVRYLQVLLRLLQNDTAYLRFVIFNKKAFEYTVISIKSFSRYALASIYTVFSGVEMSV